MTKYPTNTAWISLQEQKTLSDMLCLIWMLKELRKRAVYPDALLGGYCGVHHKFFLVCKALLWRVTDVWSEDLLRIYFFFKDYFEPLTLFCSSLKSCKLFSISSTDDDYQTPSRSGGDISMMGNQDHKRRLDESGRTFFSANSNSLGKISGVRFISPDFLKADKANL